jgi:RNA polymerase sigma-70 factor (ECF subfamily)
VTFHAERCHTPRSDGTTHAVQVYAPIMTTTTPHELGREALSHADALYNHARRLTRNGADAEELVQETYVRALAGARTFTGGHLKAWLFTIMRNVFLDLLRRDRHQPAIGQLEVIDGASERIVSGDSQEIDRLQGLLGSEIEAALATLSEGARVIILLDVEGFTETEVAEVLGCAVGTVKSRLARARGLLREKLKEHAPSPRWRRDPSTGDR